MDAHMKQILAAILFTIGLSLSTSAQSSKDGSAQRAPSKPARSFVMLPAQSLSDLERKLQSGNTVAELIGGEGMQLRVAIQHDKNKPAGEAEVHDASDDVYYVLEGTASLTLGGRLESPHEITFGEWRAPRIVGGQTFEVAKGDLIIVPRGTPHQRSTVGKDFSIILIKIFSEPLRAAPQPPNPMNKRKTS